MKKKIITYYKAKRKSVVNYGNYRKPLYIDIYKKYPKSELEFYTLKALLKYYYGED